MYVPKPFQETDSDVLKALIAEFPLVTIVAHHEDGLYSSHIPLFWQDNELPYDDVLATDLTTGELIGHVPKVNPLYRQSLKSDTATTDTKTQWLVIFQDTGCYISPNWYPDKAKTNKTVPTWNYRSVHLTVEPSFTKDAEEIKEMVGKLSDIHEASQPVPWSIADAPAEYIDKMCKALVGFRLKIIDVQAQFKLSQNKDEETRASIRKNLQDSDSTSAQNMSKLIK